MKTWWQETSEMDLTIGQRRLFALREFNATCWSNEAVTDKLSISRQPLHSRSPQSWHHGTKSTAQEVDLDVFAVNQGIWITALVSCSTGWRLNALPRYSPRRYRASPVPDSSPRMLIDFPSVNFRVNFVLGFDALTEPSGGKAPYQILPRVHWLLLSLQKGH